jgi:Uma2 family endonuclease
MSTTTQAMTWAEFKKLPDTPGKRELLNGELIEMPPAKLDHMELLMRFVMFLAPLRRQFRVMAETGYRIGRGWLVPDVSIMWPEQQVGGGYAIGSPMIAIEIISDANPPARVKKKAVAYLEGGAEEVWVVYPKTRSMAIHSAKLSVQHCTSVYECSLLSITVPVAELLS